MIRKSFAQMVAAIAASAMLATGLAAPAHADNDRLMKFLAGAVVLGIIANEIDKKDGGRVRPGQPARVVPSRCAIPLRTGQGLQTYYSKQCTDQVRGLKLPKACLQTINTTRGASRLYNGTCLAERGFRDEGGWY